MNNILIVVVISFVILISLSLTDNIKINKFALNTINQKVIDSCTDSDVFMIKLSNVFGKLSINILCEDGKNVSFHI